VGHDVPARYGRVLSAKDAKQAEGGARGQGKSSHAIEHESQYSKKSLLTKKRRGGGGAGDGLEEGGGCRKKG